MHDVYNLANAENKWLFLGATTPNAVAETVTWVKPRGCAMLYILCVGPGGNGGNGAVGAASAAAGGSGGAGGSVHSVSVPAALLPDLLYCSAGTGGGTGESAVYLRANRNLPLLIAPRGNNGNNASGATPGAVATAISVSISRFGGIGFLQRGNGRSSLIGGATGAGGAQALDGLGVLGGPGGPGAGVGNAASTGFAGGGITAAGSFAGVSGGTAPGSQTVPAGDGQNGYFRVLSGAIWSCGGGGGASTGGAASGAGLKAGNGGHGGPGSGGGGGGGGFTGSTQGLGGRGGSGFIYIVAW